ncbi:MAG: alpha-amylase family glycosyl hydrolase [bacterium]|nr:alpha-amylase family glycosyl hydrolase [bacterium]
MPDISWFEREGRRSLNRLLPRLLPVLTGDDNDDSQHAAVFLSRLEQLFPRIFRLLYTLYGDRYDFFYFLEKILLTTARASVERSADLRALDLHRETDSAWFRSEKMMGGVCYVDLFAGNLEGIRQRIPYFKELGLTYLHLMPLFRAPEPNSDGGYAVSDYRRVNPSLGTMTQLTTLANDLRRNGISLVLDFVFNHTSDEHEWAQKALAGDEDFLDYYYTFPDRTLPDRYEATLREIFPEQAPGSFTYRPEIDRWVWTTFNNFQWDLNYTNPAVFDAMLGELLFLANRGVEVLRLDAVAFIWKRMGTPSESLPEVHQVIQAFNALARIAAPALVFKSEAIIHPDLVATYISMDECPISYNPTFMALIWEALATREVKLLRHSMSKRFGIPEGCAWVNYVRVHDDIGWSFADEDAAEVGIRGFDHRQFLNRFYTGQFPGSFANGVPFNFNPVNLDMRISGTAASLAGLEQGLNLQNETFIENAIRRILMIHSLILAAGGIPLLYFGDEIATLNDYSYQNDPGKGNDSRWVHRPRFNWNRAELRTDTATIEGRVFQSLQHMIHLRRQTSAFAELDSTSSTVFFDTQNPHVLGFLRNRQVLVLANFSDFPQTVRRGVLNAYWNVPDALTDLITNNAVKMEEGITLAPYQYVWLSPTV